MQKPLADFLRPESLEDMVGQHHLLDKGTVFRKSIDSNHITNMVFYGPPGVGKTTLANIIAKNSHLSLYKLNGPNASIDDCIENLTQVAATQVSPCPRLRQPSARSCEYRPSHQYSPQSSRPPPMPLTKISVSRTDFQ